MLTTDDISAYQERLQETSHQLYKALAASWLELHRYDAISNPTYTTFQGRLHALRNLLDDIESDMESSPEPF